jgi:hypothetical protein
MPVPCIDGRIKINNAPCCRCISVSATLSGFVQFSTACGDCTCAEDNRCVTNISSSVSSSRAASQCCPDPDTDCSRGIYGGPWCTCSDCFFEGCPFPCNDLPLHYLCGNILCVGFSESGSITADDGHHDVDCTDCGLSPNPEPFGCDTSEGACCDCACDDLECIATDCCGCDLSDTDCLFSCCGCTDLSGPGCDCGEDGQTALKHNIDCPGFGCTCSQGEGETLFQVSAALHKVEEGGENDCFDSAGYWVSLWWDIGILCLAGNIVGPQSYPQTTHAPSDTGMIFFLGTSDPAGTTQTFDFTDCDLDAFNCCGLEGVSYHVEIAIQ